MRGFGLTIEPLAGGAVRVALRGELDLEHAYTFDEELRRVEGDRPPCLVLDLRGAVVPGLVRSRAAAGGATAGRGASGAGCCSCAARKPVQRLMAITAVGEHFETVSEVPDELRPAGRPRGPA